MYVFFLKFVYYSININLVYIFFLFYYSWESYIKYRIIRKIDILSGIMNLERNMEEMFYYMNDFSYFCIEIIYIIFENKNYYKL